MSFEYEYHLIFPSMELGVVVLQPDEWTSSRPYLTDALIPGKPLRFVNGFADSLLSPKSERVEDMLFDGKTYGVRNKVRDLLERYEIAGLQFYPMIFQDTLGTEHLDYFYANLYIEQPFLDRTASRILPTSRGRNAPRVFLLKYAFDEAKMRGVPEEARLVFRLEGVRNANFIVHQRILASLVSAGVTGFRAFRVADFTEGMQN